jgi:hypothetical protein
MIWSLTSSSLHSGGWVAGGVDYEDRASWFSQYLVYSSPAMLLRHKLE